MFNFKKERLSSDPIGEGAYGEVFSYQKDPQDLKWVVKRPKGKKIEDLFACLPEIVLGFSCDHPCIVPVKGFSIQLTADRKYEIYTKLPRMSGGTLAEEIKKRHFKKLYFSESELVQHFYALASAVDYLHNKKIFHGDIKINNILLDEKGNIKLSDIGSAKYVPDEDLYQTMSNAPGAINYKAPEVIQHERNLRQFRLKSEDERKNQPAENFLKKEHIYLADSWSLGLAMLEMCMLVPRLIDPYDPVQLIEANLQKIKKEVDKRYRDVLLEMIFGLVKTDPTQRLKVSAVKAHLEENFGQILTEDFKISLGVKQKSKQDAPDLGRLQKKCEILNAEVEKIKTQKTQEIEEICKKYEESIQILKQENVSLLERIGKELDQNLEIEEQILPRKSRDEKAYRQKLQNVSDELNKTWTPSLIQKMIGEKELFEFKSQPFLSIRSNKEINDSILKEITSNMVDECYIEKLWEEMDGLELRLGCGDPKKNHQISDRGLKEFASQLGPRLSNLKHLVVDMNGWAKITDKGLEVFISQLAPQLKNIKHLVLNMSSWENITDEGLKAFAFHLGPNMANLNTFKLTLNYSGVTPSGLDALANQITQNLTNLQEFVLELWNCRWVKESDEKNLKTQLKHIPNVLIIR